VLFEISSVASEHEIQNAAASVAKGMEFFRHINILYEVILNVLVECTVYLCIEKFVEFREILADIRID
jgi:prolipoprotein diacylglyceryltransferase